MNRIGIFTLFCAFGGVFTLLGMPVGAAAGFALFGGGTIENPGTPIGVFAGGVFGVALAGWIACRFHLVSRSSRGSTTAGAFIGYIVWAVISIISLRTMIIPLLSLAFVGIGAILGNLRDAHNHLS